jgi:hypothetical protein
MKRIENEKDPAKKKELAEREALPVRIELARQWERMMTFQLAATDTPGEMGTVANLEQHTRRNASGAHFLDLYDQSLAGLLGKPLPPEAQPAVRYMGQPRLIVPTQRTQIQEGESLNIKAIVLDNDPPKSAALYWRAMGQGKFAKVDLRHVARGVYTVTLPTGEGSGRTKGSVRSKGPGMEYYIEATTAGGERLIWPATAPEMNQTVVVLDKQ